MSAPALPPLPCLPSPFLASLLYVTAGLAYLTVSGSDLPDRLRPEAEHVSPVARAAGTALALALVLLLWPAAPLLRATRSSPVRRLTAAWRSRTGAHRRRRVRTGGQRTHLDAQAAAARVEDFTGLDGELDIAGAASRIRTACEQQRLIDAVFMASALVDDVARRCGPDHPEVLDAMDLLAHVAHLVGDQARSVRLYVHVAGRRAWHYGVEDPGARTALRNAHASWLCAPDHAALITGYLLLPCLQMVAGPAAPITRSSQLRLQALRAAQSERQV